MSIIFFLFWVQANANGNGAEASNGNGASLSGRVDEADTGVRRLLPLLKVRCPLRTSI